MRKQILDALRTKFAGLSDSILDRIATKLAKTITEESEIAAAVEAQTLQSVFESYGDSRATEATKTAVKGYEDKYGLKDGKLINTGSDDKDKDGKDKENQPQGGEEVPAWARDLASKVEALSARSEQQEAERRTSGRRAKVDEVIGKLPESLRAPYSRLDVSQLSDDEFNTTLESISTEVDGIAGELKAKGAVFGAPKGGSGAKGAGEDEVPANVLAFLDNAAKDDANRQNF